MYCKKNECQPMFKEQFLENEQAMASVNLFENCTFPPKRLDESSKIFNNRFATWLEIKNLHFIKYVCSYWYVICFL